MLSLSTVYDYAVNYIKKVYFVKMRPICRLASFSFQKYKKILWIVSFFCKILLSFVSSKAELVLFRTQFPSLGTFITLRCQIKESTRLAFLDFSPYLHFFHPPWFANFSPYSFIGHGLLWDLLKISTLLVYLALLV